MCYLTTSRKCGPVTRRLARSLANIFSCIYENRGKRNFDSVLKRANKEGCSRVIFIYESHGNPNELFVIDLKKDEWAKAGNVKFNPVKIDRVIERKWNICYNKDDQKIKTFVSLFNTEQQPEFENVAKIESVDNKIIIKTNGKVAISLNILEIAHY